MRSPSGGKARHRGGTHIGKAPLSPENAFSCLTRGQLFGEDQVARLIYPRLCRTVRPAPQAGCFVSGLKLSKDSAQITLRHRAFRTGAVAPSSASAKRPPAAPLWSCCTTAITFVSLCRLPCRSCGLFRLRGGRSQISQPAHTCCLLLDHFQEPVALRAHVEDLCVFLAEAFTQ